MYAGPAGKGLEVGVAYVIDKHIIRANSFLALNLSDPVAVASFNNDNSLKRIC